MEVSFRTRRLERTFNSEINMSKAYGDRMSRIIQIRMAVLNNARDLSHVPTTPPDRFHILRDNRMGQFAVDLVHPKRLIFEPNHDPIPRLPDGGVNLELVTAITILEVVDYH